MKPKRIILIGVLILICASAPCHAADNPPDPDTILEKSIHSAYYFGHDLTSDVVISTVDPGRKIPSELTFRLKRLNDEARGSYKIRLDFSGPPEMDAAKLVIWRRKDNEMYWFNLPQAQTPARLSTLQRRSSFIGSEFVFEDVAGRPFGADHCVFMNSTISGHYWLKCTPRDPDSVEFKYYLVWIRQDNFIPVKFEFYGNKDELLRLIEVWKIDQVGRYPTVTSVIVREPKTGRESAIKLSDVRYDTGLSARDFEVTE